MTALVSRLALALTLSQRQTARALRTRPATVADLVRRGLLAEVPWGTRRRIPLAEVERLAREGWTEQGAPRRRSRRMAPGRCDPAAIRALKIADLAVRQP